jgi:hypothetical protein
MIVVEARLIKCWSQPLADVMSTFNFMKQFLMFATLAAARNSLKSVSLWFSLFSASVGFYESPNGNKYPRVQLLTIAGLLDNTQRPEHPDYEPDLNFKKAKAEAACEQQSLIWHRGIGVGPCTLTYPTAKELTDPLSL